VLLEAVDDDRGERLSAAWSVERRYLDERHSRREFREGGKVGEDVLDGDQQWRSHLVDERVEGAGEKALGDLRILGPPDRRLSVLEHEYGFEFASNEDGDQTL